MEDVTITSGGAWDLVLGVMTDKNWKSTAGAGPSDKSAVLFEEPGVGQWGLLVVRR